MLLDMALDKVLRHLAEGSGLGLSRILQESAGLFAGLGYVEDRKAAEAMHFGLALDVMQHPPRLGAAIGEAQHEAGNYGVVVIDLLGGVGQELLHSFLGKAFARH